MARFELLFKRSVAKDLRHPPQKDLVRVLKRIQSLKTDPRPAGCEQLSAQERYRLRQGSYRIIYEIREEERVVIIIKVAHRRDVYEHLNEDTEGYAY